MNQPVALLALVVRLATSVFLASSGTRPPKVNPGGGGHQPAPAPSGKGSGRTGDARLTLEQLGAEFRRIRAAGGANADGEVWRGRKHLVMEELVQRLGQAHPPRARVIALMGKPDDETSPERASWWEQRRANNESSPRVEGPSTVIVYQWRGWHDFAYFQIQNGKVREAGWWMAGE